MGDIMRIEVQRIVEDGEATLSTISLEGSVFSFGLEDQRQAIAKVMDETRVPAGSYRTLLRDAGGMNKRYHAKFPQIHKGMLHLQGVLGFTYIYFHIGNTDDDTSGCILVGRGASILQKGLTVQSSTPAYLELYSAVSEAAFRDELTTEIYDIVRN